MTDSIQTAAPAQPTSTQAAPARMARRVPLPRTWSIRPGEVLALVVGNGLMIVAMWVRHGGVAELGTLGGTITATGQLTALLGTYLILIQLVLMSRSPWLDQLFGMDRLAAAHRWVGFGAVTLLAVHGVSTTVGYALGDGLPVVSEAWTLVTTYPYVLMATVSMALFGAVAVSSIRLARRRLSYETWYGIHLYAYLAVALGFAHQLAVGTDFAVDPVARVYWVALYVIAVASVLVFRIGQPVYVSLRHRLQVAAVVPEGPGVVSIYITGRDLDRLAVRSGQYFLWRFLTREGWWRAHPFSLSAAPNGQHLRLTIKVLGDYSGQLQALRPGVRVFAEGPYGVLTGARRTRQRVLFIAGGIGITPLRALLQGLPGGPGDLTLLYRASSWEDVLFRRELDELMRVRGAAVHYLVGKRGTRELPGDPLGARSLRQLVPDVSQRDVFVCGPTPMTQHVLESLSALGVPDAQIHWEHFSY